MRSAWLGACLALAACGDPLTEGDWRGTPAMVIRGGTVPLPPEAAADLELALVWAPLADAEAAAPPDGATFPVVAGDVASDRDFGAFELALHDAPPESVRGAEGELSVALLTVLAVPGALPDAVSGATRGELARGVSDDHYVVWARDAAAARAAGTPAILNPIALADGYNLAVGVCRPGRPSQLLVVPPERVSIIAVAEAKAGDCLDVFWGAWRAH
ncbi:MAG: hypothetical protein U1F43_09875 [Myxococcota bacterium]